uniref:DNA-directed primase/polymerase protein n=1 Tax=Sphaeramia orbicularis TaxID=375764 RepID=A0A672ZR51_9TELE
MSKWGERVKKVEQLAQSFTSNPLTTTYKPRLWPCQPSSVWKLFPRQSTAISFTKSCKEDVHVFALEKEETSLGQRIYLVTSYTELWHYYRTYKQSLMHCYEVIPEGAVCKLYFDLEFHRLSNSGADGKTMVSSLIEYVCGKLKEIYGIECSGKDVLNLDSSTEDKFSRHLIFNLPNAAFKDNIHVGRFIHAILQQVQSSQKVASALDSSAENTESAGEMTESPQTKRRKHEETDLSFLRVKNKDGQDSLFVDLGVYTRNRNFRLYKSSKVGKNAAFTVADDNKFSAKAGKGISREESIFLASLVCNVRIFFFVAISILFYVSTSVFQYNLFFDGIQGSIRRWNYFAAEQLLVYDIAKYRWCENVARFHKSNNIMIVVDLKDEVWYQKCHDPDCRNFRSSSYPLPQEICVSYIMTLDEEDQAYLMDDAGNIELSQAPHRTSQTTVCPTEESADKWGTDQDDQDYLESLDDFEQNSREISDDLLLICMADFDSR